MKLAVLSQADWKRHDERRAASPSLSTFRNHIRAKAPDLTLRQFAVLMSLAEHGPQQVKDLAFALDVRKPVISRMSTTLVDMGLIERRGSDEDGRLVYLLATDAGYKLVEGFR